jgi:hypothetical protein
MLAYLFWHRPLPEALEYEAALAAFHSALAQTPPEGFRASAAYRVTVPWCDGYEDWYAVDDWAALGALNEAAPLLAEHGPVAGMSAWGAGGVYRLLHGEPGLQAESARWAAKPEGTAYESWHASLPKGSAWQRQLVLGPAPEYCLPGEPGVQRVAVA